MHRRKKEAEKKVAVQEQFHQREAAAKAAEEAKYKAKLAYESRVKAWRYDSSGSDKGVRLLLSTLHTVLWEGAKWTPVSMGQLMSKGKVRLWYLKAVRVVHPDHHQSDASDRKYLCQQVFDGLSSSFKRFEQEEMGK